MAISCRRGEENRRPAVGPHRELWSFVRGGMTPIEALRAGTIVPATSLGMAKDIGSLEAGKLADLVILDADPTADIRNSEKVSRVMLGGRLYDAKTLDEVVTGARKRPDYWWEWGAFAPVATWTPRPSEQMAMSQIGPIADWQLSGTDQVRWDVSWLRFARSSPTVWLRPVTTISRLPPVARIAAAPR